MDYLVVGILLFVLLLVGELADGASQGRGNKDVSFESSCCRKNLHRTRHHAPRREDRSKYSAARH